MMKNLKLLLINLQSYEDPPFHFLVSVELFLKRMQMLLLGKWQAIAWILGHLCQSR